MDERVILTSLFVKVVLNRILLTGSSVKATRS